MEQLRTVERREAPAEERSDAPPRGGWRGGPMWHWARKIAVTVVGGAVVLGGAVLLVLPGPGLLVIAAGLALLATQYVWAQRLLKRVRAHVERAAQASAATGQRWWRRLRRGR